MAAREDILEKVRKSRQEAERRIQQNNQRSAQEQAASRKNYEKSVSAETRSEASYMGKYSSSSRAGSTVADYAEKRRKLTNWYKGDTPSAAETLARITQIGQTDDAKGRAAYDLFEQERATPGSPFYNPYDAATSQKQTKTTLANTQKAMNEWAALADELTYWAGRTDLNLSDDDILARVDWDNYKTLQKMDEGRLSGSPLELLAPVGYSEDAMRGVLWAARNPESSTGDAMMDAVQSAMGRGKAYVRDDIRAAQLDPSSQSYNPYAVSGTMLDLERKYGTAGFDADWLEQNMGMRGNTDYAKVYNAEQFTAEAEAELEEFNRILEEELTARPTQDVDKLVSYLFDEGNFKALAKLDESLKSGKLLDTTRAIHYDRQAIEQGVREYVADAQLREAAMTDPDAMDALVNKEKQEATQRNGGALLTPGKVEEGVPETVQKSVLFDGNISPETFQEGLSWVFNKLRNLREKKPEEASEKKETDAKKPDESTAVIANAGASDVSSIRIPTAEEAAAQQEQVYALEAEGRYKEAAEMQFPLIVAAVTNSEDEYVKELVTSVGSQEAAMYLTNLVLQGDMLDEVDDLDVWGAVTDYEYYICQVLDIDTASADMFAQAMDYVTGGAYSETKDNKGVGVIRALQSTATQAGAKLNDLWANIAGFAMTGYGHLAKGTNQLINATLGKLFDFEVQDTLADKTVEAGQQVAGYYNQISAREDAFMRQNASPLEYFAATAGSEAIKMGVQSVAGAAVAGKAAGSVSQIMSRGGARQLQTALDLTKAEGLASKLAAASPFIADSAASEFHDAYQETENPVTALMSGMVSGFATASLMNLDAIRNIERMGKYVPEVVSAIQSMPGSGLMATAKRYGKAGMMYIGNMLKTAANEAIQEPTENFLKTWVTDTLKGKGFFSERDWGEYASELASDAFYAAIGTFGNSLAAMPSWSRSAIYANQMMGKTGLTPAEVTGQLNAFVADMDDPQVASQLEANLHEAAVEARTGELLAQGGLPDVDSGAVDAAQKKADEAQAHAAETAAELESATARVDSASEQFRANPADDSAKNKLSAALKEEQSAQKANDQAVTDAQAAQAELEEAQASVQAQSDAVMGAVRAQAEAEVEGAVNGVSAYREAQEIERQTEKADAMFGYSDDARAESLAGKTVRTVDISQGENQVTATEVAYLEQSVRKDAVKYVTALVEKFGVLKKYSNQNADIEFEFTKSGLKESANKQIGRGGTYSTFAKMLANLDGLVANAIPVETHTDKYVGTKREDATLKRVYVLLSAYRDGDSIVPVQFSVKEFIDKENKLYVAVSMQKTEAADLNAVTPEGTASATAASTSEEAGRGTVTPEDTASATAPSEISIPDLVSKINPVDGEFLKYIPDSMLSSEQQASKEKALEKERRKIEGLKEKKEDPNVSRTQVPPQVVRPGNSPTGKLVNPVESAKKLAKTLGVGERIGTRKMNNMPQAVLGYYHNRARYLAVRSRQAGNITVTMHELGHAISQRLGITGTNGMIANLPAAFAQNYAANELPGEAFAEFMWRYMTDDAEAEAFAGTGFIYQFEQALRREGLADAVHTARDEMHAFVNANVNSRIGAMVVDRSKKERSSIKEKFTALLAGLADDTAALEVIDSDLRRRDTPVQNSLRDAALMRNTASRRAWNILTGSMTDSDWSITGDSLATVIERTGMNGRDFDLLNNYMLAVHSLDRDAQGLPVFDDSFTTAERQALIADVQTNHPEVAAAAQAVNDWWHEFMQSFMVDTGYLSQETFDRFMQMYPHYVPTNRVKKRGVFRGNGGGSTYTVRRATGSTEEIYNPIDSLVQNVNTIVNMVSQNNVGLVFDNLYSQYDGLGIYARDVTQDMRQDRVNTEGLRDEVEEILTNANTDQDAMEQVLDLIGNEQTQWRMTGNVNLPNVMQVRLPDGTRRFYEFSDNEIFKAITGLKEQHAKSLLDYVGRMTRSMSALTTGSNPLFGIRNFMRDFQKSVNYGSWATGYADGLAKWLRSAYEVWRESGDYEQYKALGGGGWTRIDANTKKGAAEYRGELFRGYNTSNVGRTVKWVGKRVWDTVTLSRLNEIVEQASRFAEYRFGEHDTTTDTGRQEAFLAAQEVTVDFKRAGNSQMAHDLKQLVPFFNASVQGVYQTGREFVSEKERGRLPARFAKTVLNTAITSALASALMLKFMDDEDKEEFFWLSDDLKSDHIYIPNVFGGDTPLIRIPLAQDPLARAVHGWVTNMMWSGESADEPAIELAAIANNILDGFNPVSGTVWDPLLAMSTNKNWYGGNIVPTRMQDWHPTTQYTGETASLFVKTGQKTGISPLMLEYLAEQYSGFLGQIVIPAISKDENTGEMQGVSAVIAEARKEMTSDPLLSNDITSSFYDSADMLEQIKAAAANDREQFWLNRALTDDEARSAADEAVTMLKTGGVVSDTKKLISEAYDRIDAVNASADLTDHEKYVQTSVIRREMLESVLDANEEIGAYCEKYVNGENILTRLLAAGSVARTSTTYEKLPEVFRSDYDSGASYMSRSYEVWEATGKDGALPKVNTSFSQNKVDYTVAPEMVDEYTSVYQKSYQKAVDGITGWVGMTDDERLEALESAHRKAHDAAKKWYIRTAQ